MRNIEREKARERERERGREREIKTAWPVENLAKFSFYSERERVMVAQVNKETRPDIRQSMLSAGRQG